MEQVLDGFSGTSVYLDDILVAGGTRDEAKERLLLVL
jgi:hypothetical protein